MSTVLSVGVAEGTGGRLFGVSVMQVAVNPDPDSRLPFLLRLPLGDGLVFRVGGTWPREKAVYCHPVPVSEWPADPEIVEQVPIRSCRRRGAAIDLVLDRGRENRSQLVYTTARGREAVFWQAPRTRKQSRPAVRRPTARAGGIEELTIIVDVHERYPYRFASKPVRVLKAPLACGDYAVATGERVLAAVERKSLPDLVSSLTSGRLGYALGELAALPRAAVVVEERYSEVFKLSWVRPAVVADGLAEMQVRWPNVPIMFAQTRPLAEEWTYRYLAAATTWIGADDTGGATEASTSPALDPPPATGARDGGPAGPGPSAAAVRNWARRAGLDVPDRGRLPRAVWAAWHATHDHDAAD